MAAQSRPETKVTIGLCVKNTEKTIKECLESILNQDYPKHLMEIIVVDGGSKDQTMNIITKMISSSGTVARFFCDEGKGLATARQIVLDNTKSKYIVWVDGDVLLSRDFVKVQTELMEHNPRIALATGKYDYRKGIQTTLPATLESLGKYVDSAEWARPGRHRGFPPNDASVYLVEASRQVGGFDKTIRGASEDEDIIMKMKNRGWLIALNVKAKYYALSRETWQALWTENVWFGYGKHFLSHKYKGMHVLMYVAYAPLIYFFVGFKQSLKAYKLTSQKKSFLLPLAYVFSTLALWFGFLKAHQHGYGHKMN
jgi:glycosyltransferase involved in cell wall biosynthesis